MAIIKCKICGSDLEFVEGQSVCQCGYCGSRQMVSAADGVYDDYAQQWEQEESTAVADIEECYEAKEQNLNEDAWARREADYHENLRRARNTEDPAILDGCARIFQALGDFRDSQVLAEQCRIRAAEIREELRRKESAEKAMQTGEAQRPKTARKNPERKAAPGKKKITIISIAAAAVLAVAILVFTVVMPSVNYHKAETLAEEEKYQQAARIFLELGDYKDSQERYRESIFAWAEMLLAEGKYQEAAQAYEMLGDSKDIRAKLQEVKQAEVYAQAEALMGEGKYGEAAAAFNKLGDYQDSPERIMECRYLQAEALRMEGNYVQAAMAYYALGDYRDAWEKAFETWGEITRRDTISANGYHTVGLKADGTVVAVGNNDYGQCEVSGWRDIVAISAGGYHTVGLKADGTLVAVGNNKHGQCNVSDWTDLVAIAAGSYHTVGLKGDGTVVAVGYNEHGQCDVSGWSDIVGIVAADYHTVGLKADGTVVAVGNNDYGECDVSDWTDIVAISEGGMHTVGLKADGTVVAVGYNKHGQCKVSGWSDIVAIAAGTNHTVGLKADGTVVATKYTGDRYKGQCKVSGWRDIVAVSSGWVHTVGLKRDGTVVATKYTGDYYKGQCDVSGWENIKIPEEQTAVEKFEPGEGVIIVEPLNIRSGPSATSEKTGEYSFGDTVQILEKKDNWLRTDQGWISANYVYREDQPDMEPKKVTITATTLNVRKGPNGNYAAVGVLAKGEETTILKQVELNGEWWGFIGTGWIRMKHVSGN